MSDLSSSPHRPTGRLALMGSLTLAGLLALGIVPRMKQRDALAQATHTTNQEAAAPRVEIVNLESYVSVMPPESGLALPATLEADAEAPIAARASGYVVHRFADIGTRVQEGQLLAEIATPEAEAQVRQAEADTARAQAAEAQARADQGRLSAAVTKTTAESAYTEATVKQQRAVLDRTRLHVSQLDSTLKSEKARVTQLEHQVEIKKSEHYRAKGNSELLDKTARRWQAMAADGAVSQQAADERQSAALSAAAVVNEMALGIHAAESELAAAREAVRAREAERGSAESEVKSAELLLAAMQFKVTSSKADLSVAASGVAVGKESLRVAQSQVGVSQASTQRLSILRDYSRVTAPFAGIVVGRSADVGTLVGAEGGKNVLFTLARVDRLKVSVAVPQSLSAQVQVGQRVSVRLPEREKKELVATIVRTATALDPATRTLHTELELPNPDGSLLPGTFVQVVFAHGKERPHPRIPAAVLIAGPEGTQVVSVGADGIVHFIPITIGRDFGAELEVSAGLTGTERLILTPSDDLREGQRVQAVEAKPSAPPPSSGKQGGHG